MNHIVQGLVLAAAAAAATFAGATTLPAQGQGGAMATFGKAAAGQVVFDQGPSTGANGGCWSNFTQGQNFSDPAPLPAGTVVAGIVVYTCIAPMGGTVTFKAVDENSHSFLHVESGAPSSWVGDGGSGYIVTYMLNDPYVVPAGVGVGYGLSGDGFELGQYSVLTPVDGLMSQYAGETFSFHTAVGDQMFQLLGDGDTDCDVNGDGKFSARDLRDFLKECRHSGGQRCFVQTARLAKRCSG